MVSYDYTATLTFDGAVFELILITEVQSPYGYGEYTFTLTDPDILPIQITAPLHLRYQELYGNAGPEEDGLVVEEY